MDVADCVHGNKRNVVRAHAANHLHIHMWAHAEIIDRS